MPSPARKRLAVRACVGAFVATALGMGAAVLAAMGSAAGSGCAVYDESLLIAARPFTKDGSVDVGPDAPDAVVDTCAHARWPARPVENTPTERADIGFVVALRRVSLGTAADAGPPPPGADLDDVCTCTTGGGSCLPSAATDQCDSVDGRDNAGGDLFRTLARRTANGDIFNERGLNSRIEAGEIGIALEVREYNGESDDTNVFVAMFPSNGVADTDGGRPRAKWDGTDVWTRDPGGLLGGGTAPGSGAAIPKYIDENAYVAGGVLVAKVDFPIALGAPGNAAIIELTGGVLYARIVKALRGRELDEGQIVGRWPASKLLPSLAVYDDPIVPSMPLCGDSPTYQVLKKLVCERVDVRSDATSDATGASCDALSLGIGFIGGPARLGPARARPPQPPGCGPTWADDCAR